MNNKRILYLIIAVVLVGALFVLFLNSGSEEPTAAKRKKVDYSSHDWKVDLSLDNKNPYGLYAFRELTIADGRFTEFNAVSDYNLLDSIVQLDSSMLMFIGMDLMLTDEEIDLVLESIDYGNDFFISAEKIPSYLLDQLMSEKALTYYPNKKAPHKINKKVYDMYYFYENDTLTEIWDLFNPKKLDTLTNVLSTIYGRPNYIEIEYGLGKVFIHLNPLVFTNVQLLKSDGKSYFKEVLLTLEQPKIQWLTFANFEAKPYSDKSTSFENNKSLLSELFKHPAFRWGFILAVFGVLLFLLFRSKRRQPIIPAVEDNKNTGFSYVDTLAGIYYNKEHGDKILKIMRRNFYSAVYDHFYIDLAKREDSKPIIALSKKSNIPTSEIEQLIKYLEVTTKVSDIFLSNTYKIQRSFYLKSGIWNEEIRQKQINSSVSIYRQKERALGTIGLGIFIIVLGFIFLSVSLGVGVLFWPLGIVGIVIGTRMLNTPAIILNPGQIELNPLFGKKVIILHENIKFIEEKGLNSLIYFKNGGKATLNNSQLDQKKIKALDHLKQRFKQT
ncbi:hypothetical protein ERX46_09055 [Brumimicrobium glaciale]|uniref:DUF4350 domain-containing protein n=1 Tax=Brumimicrobium glaciale TaxID=200475 RepID=A0A4Q4KMU7_9FLAO|nr:hypothetical protein [Brumimicrobium glaciale]RYM34097.1 hypothetical protein ERX46_09055 [Brumimicrobium glaciale]